MKHILVVGEPLLEKVPSVLPEYTENYAVTGVKSYSEAHKILSHGDKFDAIIVASRHYSGCSLSFLAELGTRGHDNVIVLHDGGLFKKHSPHRTITMMDALGAKVLLGPHSDQELSASLCQALAA